MISTIILVFLGIIGALIAALVGLVGYIVLKLMKNELNITMKSDDTSSTQPLRPNKNRV
jgi:hypothetical protein